MIRPSRAKCHAKHLAGVVAVLAGLACTSLALPFAGPASAQIDCGEASDCVVPGGSYRLLRPQRPARQIFMFFHGYGSSAATEAATPGFRQWAEAQGVIVLLPDGIAGGWSVAGTRHDRRDDVAFAGAVLADARRQLALPDVPAVIGGFSLGASMAWALACAGRPEVAGYIMFSGTFWEPVPTHCTFLPVPIIHFHGWNDTVVPLAGRQVRTGLRQAPLDQAFARLAADRSCPLPPVWQAGQGAPEGLTCATLTACRDAALVQSCLHDKGHNFSLDWLSYALASIARPGMAGKTEAGVPGRRNASACSSGSPGPASELSPEPAGHGPGHSTNGLFPISSTASRAIRYSAGRQQGP